MRCLLRNQGEDNINMLSKSSRFFLLKEKTGMVIIEVEFVTGWEAADPDSLVNVKEIQRVDTDKEENKVP